MLKLELSSYISQLEALEKQMQQKQLENEEVVHLKQQLNNLMDELEKEKREGEKSMRAVREI